MTPICFASLMGAVACVIVTVIYPFVLRYAVKHNIMDNPNARKLQRTPVPVFGGVAVFSGMLPAVLCAGIFFDGKEIMVFLCGAIVMLVIGVWDDIKDISASLKFCLEIIVVLLMMLAGGCPINDFHGLWGIHGVPCFVSWPLSVIAGVGIINAINLIDGVNGYSSGFVIISSIIFSVFFFHVGMDTLGCVALIGAGALIPFFLHNVFGDKSKMFIGDGGTLVMGTALAFFAANCLTSRDTMQGLENQDFGLVAFTLAVLNIPVFDTVRVMSARIFRHISPFNPDKTHLHHLFIDMGFSHSGTTAVILLMNSLTVLFWFLSWKLGASINAQTYIVVALGFLNTFVFYKFMKVQGARDSRIYRLMCRIGSRSHIGHTRFWQLMRSYVDSIS